ncbi:hypothetical protein [[Mycobacterium] crassicus]|uniref:Uncharacterized protein n=1 Tax=[Mycobacterium] crassicus TaxID=2872309 RepID=A0ABU5XNN9_9MYCO|nr:hypothetical protein [Mycolicibacter sp. MYC098]MEB3022907.1 hypothetical protein [Mycolicibacter sp. MYC098]
MSAGINPATHPTAVLYRRTLIELDQTRVQLVATGAARHVIAALDDYRSTIQTALHTEGVTQ